MLFVVAVVLLASGVAIATSIAKKEREQMDSHVAPSYETLQSFTGWIWFEGQWYILQRPDQWVDAVVSVPDQFSQFQRHLRVITEGVTLVQMLTLTEEVNGRRWMGWLRKIGEGEPEPSDIMEYQGQTYVLDAQGSGSSKSSLREESYSFHRYKSQVDDSFILCENLNGWWRHCMGREVGSEELVLQTPS